MDLCAMAFEVRFSVSKRASPHHSTAPKNAKFRRASGLSMEVYRSRAQTHVSSGGGFERQGFQW